MPKITDHNKNIGKKYGKLTVLSWYKKGRVYYECLCDCGNKTTKIASNVLCGQTTSCGCNRTNNESLKERARQMGLKTRHYEEICTNCGKKEHYARGYCRNCYARYMRNGTPKRVNKRNGE